MPGDEAHVRAFLTHEYAKEHFDRHGPWTVRRHDQFQCELVGRQAHENALLHVGAVPVSKTPFSFSVWKAQQSMGWVLEFERAQDVVISVINLDGAPYPHTAPLPYNRAAAVPNRILVSDNVRRFEEKDVVLRPMTRSPGEYYRRIGTPAGPSLQVTGLKDTAIETTRVRRMVEARLRDAFLTVEPVPAHAKVYGHLLREVLLLASMEVENGWKAILEANNATPMKKYFDRNDYVKLVGPLHLKDYALRLTSHPQYGDIRPFANWSGQQGSLPWYDAYNDTKHSREKALQKASLEDVINATAAVHVMGYAQFGKEFLGVDGRQAQDEFIITEKPRFEPEELPCNPHAVFLRNATLASGWKAVDYPF
jgi:hypothetical protein